jgi:hypothetical protein
LHRFSWFLANIIRNPSDICIVQRRVHFVQNKERRWLVAVFFCQWNENSDLNQRNYTIITMSGDLPVYCK